MKINSRGFLEFVFMFVIFFIGVSSTARAEVDVNINFGPPPIRVATPLEVVYMPQAGVYFVPELSFDVFFYNGYWWSPRGDRWYRASKYNGPWVQVRRYYVPERIVRVPRNYREIYRGERRIDYGQWKKQYHYDEHNDEHRDEGRRHRD
ncbi:MAG: hypothetical protein PHV30_07235 [Candidatus Margulisbacteria bacterium]|nr:hypothetical protein [Candidatus Margulisiibacteriota bacterium]